MAEPDSRRVRVTRAAHTAMQHPHHSGIVLRLAGAVRNDQNDSPPFAARGCSLGPEGLCFEERVKIEGFNG
jgi:hypothetical protein